jgi:hypothetical protein
VTFRTSQPSTLCRLSLFVGIFLCFSGQSYALTNLNVRLVSNVKPSANPLAYGDVWAENDLACLGVWLNYSTYNYGVGIYSITNPTSPALLSIYSPAPTSQNQFELGAIKNKIGYFGSWSGGGLHIVSLTNPAAPVLLARVAAITGNVTNGFDRVHTIWLERNFLYEAAHVTGIVSVKVFDISNPKVPVYLQDIVTTNTTKVHQITVRTKGATTILYTSGWGGNNDGDPASPGQTDLWDVSNVGTQAAHWLGRVYSGYNSHSSYPTPDGNTLIVCRETPGGDVRLYDISNPATLSSNTAPLVTITPASMGLEADIPHNPVVVSNMLFVSWYQNGIQVFDISDRTRPVRVGFYDTYPAAQSSSFQGNWGVFPHLGFDKLLLSDIQSGLFIMDATAVLSPTNNYPPLIVTQPMSATVTQGTSMAFTAIVTGSDLHYQWQFNNVNIAGSTGSTLNLSNVQGSNAGTYMVVISNSTAQITSSAASLSVSVPQTFQSVFYEPFDSPTANTNWNLFDGSANGVSDYTVNWSYDYSTYFSSYNNKTIPPAPGTTNGTTRGLRLTVNNNDATAATAGVSVYPKNKNFSGAYKLTFDLWINYPGSIGGAGSTGSTEHGTFGINHSGNRVNWASANPSDGVWFSVDGEGGTTGDYRAYVGSNAANPTLLSFANSGFGASGAVSVDNIDSYWQSIFPSPAYESAGAPGKHWVQVEVSQDQNNVVTWRMNGNLIAQRPNTSTFTNGTIMLGYMDLFTSIASPAADAFVLFDNVRVSVSTPLSAPSITAQPQSVTLFPGQDGTFTVAATGSAPLAFQWRFDGADIAGATSNSFTRFGIQPEDTGYYSVVISNAAGVAVSTNALLILQDSPYVSAVRSTSGSHSALISWNTTVPADSLVQFEIAPVVLPASASASASFLSSSYLEPSLTTNHVILLTGLLPGTLYNFEVISTADTNSYVSGVYQFSTAGSLKKYNTIATVTGSWSAGPPAADQNSTDKHSQVAVPGGATATATFRPAITTAGKYDVYAWYPQAPNQATNTPFMISYNGGDRTTYLNQQTGGGAWQLLAQNLDFGRGTNGFVQIANNAGPGSVVADAVRFVYVESQDFPTDQAIPAWWQNFYFGGQPDPSADPDQDGYTTAQEYVMGTSPTNGNSHFELIGENATNSARISFWPFLGDRAYQLLYRPDIGAPTWQMSVVTNATSVADGHGFFTLGITNAPQNYYRLKVQLTTNGTFSGNLPAATGKSYSPYASEPLCGPNRAYIQ